MRSAAFTEYASSSTPYIAMAEARVPFCGYAEFS